MPLATVNANLFRIAHSCVSTEKTRYYLNGVFIQPAAAGGVLLTSTDGHRLICVHDVDGSIDAPAIVKLPADVLKACKPSRKDIGKRLLTILGDTATIVDRLSREGEPDTDLRLAVFDHCLIDGSFPDWRRVLPRVGAATVADTFAPHHLTSFGDIGSDIAATALDRPSRRNGITHSVACATTILSWDIGSAALVRWDNCSFAFGILMPTRGEKPSRYPDFLQPDAAWLFPEVAKAEPVAA